MSVGWALDGWQLYGAPSPRRSMTFGMLQWFSEMSDVILRTHLFKQVLVVPSEHHSDWKVYSVVRSFFAPSAKLLRWTMNLGWALPVVGVCTFLKCSRGRPSTCRRQCITLPPRHSLCYNITFTHRNVGLRARLDRSEPPTQQQSVVHT